MYIFFVLLMLIFSPIYNNSTLSREQLSLHLLLCFMFFLPRAVLPFTVIMSDSGAPSTLVDGPQTGFSMKQDGARTDTHEQEAVYDIMKATGNDWATDIPDVCRGRWHGIECMPDKDNVYHVVSLSFGALSDDTAFPTCDPTRSFISPSITKLPHLKTLFFYRCFSYNPQRIPAFLGQLGPSLQTLVLRENGHVGPIPNELGNLTRLRVLDLHKNNLNGSIPVSLGRITGLSSLDLSVNKLTGSVPGLSFPGLNILDMSQNLLMGPIPSTLWDSQSLIKMDFSRNRLVGPMPEKFKGLKELMLMDLSYNRIQGPFPMSLKSLNSLQALILKGNPMGSTTIPSDGFDCMKGLMFLILSNMNLNGPVPESLGRLPNLRVLHLDGNHLNGSIPKSFRDLRNLSELKLNDNRLSGSVPFEREMVWRMKRKLRLYNNSGLCYDSRSGFGDSVDDFGISLCESSSPGSVRTVQHLSVSEKTMPMPTTMNVSSDAVTRSLGLATFVLFTLSLLL
ncbi:protein TOO MANY MOUTHS [Gastrolobium bilobum]|uniref:protein TOO MANY MOUTHS n=1 Tax=Gastrolobium bilobum TaxID=150636 RepID=UPI002AB1D621|nr:protein TOO MANY MOUTHS [Gastrolobium bilobum]